MKITGEIKNPDSLVDLEFELLKEIEVEDIGCSDIDFYCCNNWNMLKFVKLEDGMSIFKGRRKWEVINQTFGFKVGDCVFTNNKNIFLVNPKLIPKIKTLADDRGFTCFLDELQDDELKEEHVDKYVDEADERRVVREEQDRLQTEQRKIEEHKKKMIEDQEYQDFENGITKSFVNNSITWKFKQPLKDLLDYDKFNNFKKQWSYSKRQVFDYFVAKEIDFTMEKDGNVAKIEAGGMNTGRKTKLNGINCNKTMLFFMVNKCLKSGITEEEIKLFKNLSQMKIEFMEREEMEIKNIKIPMENTLISKDRFKVKIADWEQEMEWKFISEKFFWGRNMRSWWRESDFVKLVTEEFDVSKKDMFEMLRNLKVVQSL